ncbi:putative M18 family aminopeptidase 1 [Kordiimonas sediminis]|uniref:M18 family aminopeptidase n=1 Tax=Kordiimonas sediminis TaxID=1735581 RepID=A0A919ARI6_9PROT|nr:aminopeptidase 1 [Kordiimonas sediminis]GHF22403.1 putative M18 family aminopeptidase 1 [Kordiimonas sediminis]
MTFARTILSAFMLSTAITAAPAPMASANELCQQATCENGWKNADPNHVAAAMQFGEDYKSFLAEARTELLTVAAAIKTLKANGFKEWSEGTQVNKGDKYYHSNRDRALAIILGGKASIKDGVRIVASHIDSPRLELKGRPLYEKQGFALFQTNYHGGIRTYQWTNIPLALVGRVDRKDGSTTEINVGLNPDDPIFIIPELSPHTSRDRTSRKASDLIAHEELDPIVASGPHGEESVGKWVLSYLKDTYGIEPADLVSAELSLVPAMRPRDVGFDRRLMAIYGQDDRLAGFSSLIAATEANNLPQTAIIYLADNEESGNNNVTGASSMYLPNLIGNLLYAEIGDAYRQPILSGTFAQSKALSIDVNPGVNPMNPSAWELGNAPHLGGGVNIKLYGRGFDANSELIAWTRAALDANDVPWQTSTYKVGKAGGGTLGRELARQNIDTIDFGAPVLSIHTPYAVSDKLDLLAMKDGIKAFVEFSR